uniref:Uncharacterized protein n=1 Tax=Vespula pensylvanica TaxID=30213 RepID=A0A834U589_VESPE|nr:hypothetical protein H0235_011531 [Vespula pensylvanica]
MVRWRLYDGDQLLETVDIVISDGIAKNNGGCLSRRGEGRYSSTLRTIADASPSSSYCLELSTFVESCREKNREREVYSPSPFNFPRILLDSSLSMGWGGYWNRTTEYLYRALFLSSSCFAPFISLRHVYAWGFKGTWKSSDEFDYDCAQDISSSLPEEEDDDERVSKAYDKARAFVGRPQESTLRTTAIIRWRVSVRARNQLSR